MADLRASDADRERTVEALRHHALAGRLTVDELDDRLERTYAARMMRELDDLMADLPAAPARPSRPARPPGPRGRRPRFPGRYGFSARWYSPANERETMRDLMRHVAPPMERCGYHITQRRDGRLRFEREVRPLWTVVVAILAFPVGLFALLYKDRERITIDLDEDEQGTHLVATGCGPLPIRREFAELED